MSVRALTGATILGLGCAPPPATPAEPEPAPEREPEPISEPEPEPEPEPDSEPAPPPVDPTKIVLDQCEEICARTEKACSARAADFCRASCRDYEMGAQKCPVEIHEALKCQSEAGDFNLCSNIAAETCAPLYVRMQDCRSDKVSPEPWGQTHAEVTTSELPKGWERMRYEEFGFSVAGPTSLAREEKDGGLFRAVGTDASHTEYIVELVEKGNTRPPTDVSILKTATKFVGNDCQPKLRLHGRFDKKGVIFVRFDTVCKDGAVYHGMLHLFDGKALVLTTKERAEYAEPGKMPGLLEDFIFSFEQL